MSAAALNFVLPDRIFGYALSMIAWLVLCTWASILITHLRYVRSQTVSGGERPWYRLWGAPVMNWILLAILGWFAFAFATHGSIQVTLSLLAGWIVLLLASHRLPVRGSSEARPIR